MNKGSCWVFAVSNVSFPSGFWKSLSPNLLVFRCWLLMPLATLVETHPWMIAMKKVHLPLPRWVIDIHMEIGSMDFRKMCNVQVEILTFRKKAKALRDLSNVFRHQKNVFSMFILFESEKLNCYKIKRKTRLNKSTSKVASSYLIGE